jgi:ATP-dependent RNA helicase RhlE
MTFVELGLAEPLLRALNDAQYINPTPIQGKSIPSLLLGRDLLGLAETGTGKTAAFVLPILHRLAAEGRRSQPGAPRALILAPTRELAIQIGESIHTYGRYLKLSHTVIFGGVGQRPQVNAIARGVDILVATPGRLIDLIEQRHVRLDQVQTFVLDEADRMLDMGFVRDVRRILKAVPHERHSLLFSATMPEDIARLAAEILKDPVRVEIARAGKTVDRIDQRVMFVNSGAKREVLNRLLQDPEMRRVIVFTRTKRGADRVCQALEHRGIGVFAIHGNKSQGQRQSALDSFRKGFTRVLVATDIAARGIDIDEITHVVNYELPNIPESYVHRIGRTARAGASGVAIAFCAPDEREYLRDIEKLTGRRLSVVSSPIGNEAGAEQESAVAQSAPARESREQNGHDRQSRPSRPARDGARPHRGDGGPRRERSEGGRPPRRDGDRRPAHAARTERRDEHRHEGEGLASRRDAHRGERHGEHNGAHRRHGETQARPHGEERSEGRRTREHSRPHGERREGEQRSESPQPWRNWSRGGEASKSRGEGPRGERPHGDRPARQGAGDGGHRGEGRKPQNPGRPRQDRNDARGAHGRGEQRRGDGQGRGRVFR